MMYLCIFCAFFCFSKFIKRAELNFLEGRFWTMGRMFDTPTLEVDTKMFKMKF